jgi:L-amino acid N-acyltransferase YncA
VTAAAHGISIVREAFTRALYEEALPLLTLHWREIAHFQDIPLDPDVERYITIESNDALRVFTARLDGKLVGYACFLLAPHSHYKGSLQAVQDVLYVDPACRCSTIGLRLIRHCNEALALEGVQVVLQHVKDAHPALGIILERMGFERVETIYAVRLDQPLEREPADLLADERSY